MTAPSGQVSPGLRALDPPVICRAGPDMVRGPGLPTEPPDLQLGDVTFDQNNVISDAAPRDIV